MPDKLYRKNVNVIIKATGKFFNCIILEFTVAEVHCIFSANFGHMLLHTTTTIPILHNIFCRRSPRDDT